MSITRINEFKAASGKGEELMTFLQSAKSYVTSSPGCASCEILRSQEEPEKIVVIEKWDSIESHKASVAGFPKLKMMAAISLVNGMPKGAYYQT